MTQSTSGKVAQARVSRRAFLASLGATLGAIAAAGCGTAPATPPTATADAKAAGPSVAPADKAESTSIKFATVASGAVGFLTHVMGQRKIDSKHGLTLELVPADPAAAEKALLVKQVDAGLFPIISAARANTEGQPIRVFGPLLWSHNYGLTYADRPYSKLADLRGKKIATLDPISGTYQATQLLAAAEGLNFEKDFQVVTSPAPAVLAFLERGDVEGIIHFEPNIGNLLTTGNYKVFLDYNAEWKRLTGQNMFSIGLAAHEPWIAQHRDIARRLLEASLDSAQVINADPSVFGQYAAYLGLDTPEKVKAAQERMPKIYPIEWNQAIAENAESIIRRAVEQRILNTAPDRPVTIML
jgi:ABC-type nitrate/sulfonate/bicarbonate transport system substrate-binding protein